MGLPLSPRISDLNSGTDARTTAAQSVLTLTRVALAAPSLPEGLTPTLEHLVSHTAAVGAAYFQAGDQRRLAYHVRAATGDLPQTPGMAAIAAHGLPAGLPLLLALEAGAHPLFFDDTARDEASAGFPELGVCSLAAAPVCTADGTLLGAFLMHTFEPHAWTADEAALFSMVASTIAALAGRLVAEEHTTQARGAAEAFALEAVAAREAALRALGLALEVRDGETQGHTDRVCALALRLAERFGLKEDAVQALRWGAYLHDIGKLAIPDAVLLKPGRLNAQEWAIMQMHVSEGHRLAETLGFLPLAALAVITQHHERWDGGGYPRGLREQEISLGARIFAVCDVFDALTSERPYKAAWTREAALAELQVQAGQQFDPGVVRAFVAVLTAQSLATPA
ncbi:HD-GYP domain-containing protein [Deinococcus sp. QL22]|uniref:HD-GYP domain-containing protein n=1 Tax=Deinococcus sp. QL22 TaxID=2939437 RepID=UPI0020175519|nr:HD-GYP domain-containing protein [Deinococcus sp. QL22]UQN09056.1 HD-GYP domain-containing protein [Deinococcus sp. QL22]